MIGHLPHIACALPDSYTTYAAYFNTLDFTTIIVTLFRDQGSFQSFVGAIRCESGIHCDSPEDIMGGLNITFKELSWRREAAKVHNIISNLKVIKSL